MKKMGRPKGNNNKDCICTIRIDARTQRRLESYCVRMKVAKSEAVRDAIELLIKNESNTVSKSICDNSLYMGL